MNSICLFSSYLTEGEIPYYIRIYLLELVRHNRKVVFVTNLSFLPGDSEHFLKANQIEFFPVKNEGYDFGMWAKAMNMISTEGFDRLMLINDSCLLLGRLDSLLDKINSRKLDYAGLLSSEEIQPHIQSYFLVLSPQAIPVLKEYFALHGIQTGIKEVIHTYEIGLTRYMEEKGLSSGTVFSGLPGKGRFNPVYSQIERLIEEGFPLIKKKLLFNTFSREERLSLVRNGVKTGSAYYLSRISRLSGGLMDLSMLENDRKRYASGRPLFLLNAYVGLYSLLRKIAGRPSPGQDKLTR
jgi:lipopolysaccharide biosynthesis protein